MCNKTNCDAMSHSTLVIVDAALETNDGDASKVAEDEHACVPLY